MRICVIALFALVAPALHAVSIDCNRSRIGADRLIERAICADPKLAAADSSMGVTYREDLGQLSSTSIGLLRADQVQWLAWAQQLCHADDASTPQHEMVNCLQPLYADRIKTLRKAVIRRDGLSFLMRTQYLAALDIEKAPEGSPYPGFGTLEANWPVADSTDEDWIAWNHAIEQRVLRLAGQFNSAPAPPQWTDDLAAGGDFTVVVHLKSVEHDRVTAGLLLGAMLHGAAQPLSETWGTQTYLLNEHRPLRADDIFRADSDWKQALAEACWQQMSTGDGKTYLNREIAGPDSKVIQEVLLDMGNWTLEPDGLHISYPESISSRIAPMEDAVISWDSLRPLLSPRFVLP